MKMRRSKLRGACTVQPPRLFYLVKSFFCLNKATGLTMFKSVCTPRRFLHGPTGVISKFLKRQGLRLRI